MWGEVRFDVQKIIEAYRKQKSLWNPKHPGYKNKRSREEAYDNMIQDLKLPSLTANDVRLKIKSIRTIYRKELALFLRRKSEGRHQPPKLVWFQQAHSFLKTIDVPKPTRWLNKKNELKVGGDGEYDILTDIGNDESSLNVINENDPIDLNDDCEQIIDEDIKKIILSSEDDITEIDEYDVDNNVDTNEINTNYSIDIKKSNVKQNYNSFTETDDEYQKFCNSIAAQLREIPDPYSRSMAKFKIQQIIFEAETGQYKKGNLINFK